MAAGEFQDDSIGWQIQQAQRRVVEWLDYQLTSPANQTDSPTVNELIPAWLERSLVILIAALFLIWLVRRIYPAIRNRWRSPRSPALRNRPNSNRPTEADRSAAYWLQQAQVAQRQGDYRRACQALYLAMLQRLHTTQAIADQPSRTDGEYWQLVQQLPRSHPYQVIIRTHERLCFSQTPISAEEFRHCQQAYREIEQS